MNSKYIKPFLHIFSANFIVRFINLIRQLFLAWWIGPSKVLDLFFFLISIPALLTNTWNRALETTLLSTYEKNKSAKDALFSTQNLARSLYSLCIISFIIYSLVSLLFPVALYLFYAKYFSIHVIFSVFLVNIFFLIETFLVGIRIIKYSERDFFLPSIIPVIQSLILIFGILLFRKNITVIILSIFYSFGSIFQVGVVFKNEFKDLRYNFKNTFDFASVKNSFKDSSQLALASGLSSMNFFVDQNFALSLGVGSNTYIHYGKYFLTIFIVLFVKNINTIYFPQFQNYVINHNNEGLRKDAEQIIKIIFLLSLFIIIVLINNGYFFIDLILGHGKMNDQDLKIIYYCMLGYGGTFLGAALNAVLVRILHVFHEYKMIVYVAIVNFLVHIIFNFIFSYLFGVWGIAVSTSLSFITICIIYFIFLAKKFKLYFIKNKWWLRYLTVLVLLVIYEYITVIYYSNLLQTELLQNFYILFLNTMITLVLFLIFKLIKIDKLKIKF